MRAKEAHYTKTLKPWQVKVSAIAVGVNEKLLQAKRMQTTVTSLPEEKPTVDLVNATRESVDQIIREIAELRASYTQLNNEIWDIVRPLKTNTGGSRTSHK